MTVANRAGGQPPLRVGRTGLAERIGTGRAGQNRRLPPVDVGAGNAGNTSTDISTRAASFPRSTRSADGTASTGKRASRRPSAATRESGPPRRCAPCACRPAPRHRRATVRSIRRAARSTRRDPPVPASTQPIPAYPASDRRMPPPAARRVAVQRQRNAAHRPPASAPRRAARGYVRRSSRRHSPDECRPPARPRMQQPAMCAAAGDTRRMPPRHPSLRSADRCANTAVMRHLPTHSGMPSCRASAAGPRTGTASRLSRPEYRKQASTHRYRSASHVARVPSREPSRAAR